ncbi:QRFP-like peptide receptor isoform X1 [Amphiura filiformis]|uniref:QRFP-like peptide receptor isoform X1 n=1 Tax=Amphiura filiformis TaxID=82378 RepID=UPI003B221844
MDNSTISDSTIFSDMSLEELLVMLCTNRTNMTFTECLEKEQVLTILGIPPLVVLPTLAVTLLIVAYIIVFVLALIGNSLVVIVITRRRSMRTVINMFIFSLAISDLLIVLLCVPFTLVDTLTIDWVLGPFLCKALNYIAMVAIVESTLTLLVIALERHHAICYPLRARMIKNPRKALYVVGVLWFLSMCLVSPLLVVTQVIEHHDTLADVVVLRTYRFCEEQWTKKTHKQNFTLFLVVLLYVIPLTTMVVLYLRIANQLWVRKAVTPGDMPRSKASSACSLRYKKKATKMLIIVVVLFASSWLPYHIVNVFRDFTHLLDSGHNRLMLAIVQLVGFSNSFNNPIVYVFLNENFKRNFLRTLTFNRRRQMLKGKKGAKTGSTNIFPPYNVATNL